MIGSTGFLVLMFLVPIKNVPSALFYILCLMCVAVTCEILLSEESKKESKKIKSAMIIIVFTIIVATHMKMQNLINTAPPGINKNNTIIEELFVRIILFWII